MQAILVLSLLFVDLKGECVAVSDGDTIKILVDKEQVVVRLASIDAPEKRQPFGTKSREHLAELVFRKECVVEVTGKDGYGRKIGKVRVDDVDVNSQMVKDGFAWQYKQYDKSKELEQIEREAREAKRGLWADKDPVPPWEWRKVKP